MKKIILKLVLIIIALLLIFSAYLFIGNVPKAKEIKWGVNFSQKYAQELSLDWKEVYTAILDDLGVKYLKVGSYWNLIEPEQGSFNFDDLDWQIQEAQKRNAKILLTVGMKAPRWPECHIPSWAKGLSKKEQQEEILKFIREIVSRYQDNETVSIWQVENEPFFPFGECPWVDKKFLKEEIKLVKSLDPLKRPVLISDSGEGSFWIMASRYGDIVGTTMYKNVWMKELKMYFHYPFPPSFYGRKAEIVKKIFGKDVICVELQAEPWGPELVYRISLKEQEKTMNLEQFRYNMSFAEKTGLKEFYLWGSEWWFLMKQKENRPEIWDEAKKLF